MEYSNYLSIDEFLLDRLHEENSREMLLKTYRKIIMGDISLFFTSAVTAVNDDEPEELFDPLDDNYGLLLNCNPEYLNSRIMKKIQPAASDLQAIESHGGIFTSRFEADKKLYYVSDVTGLKLMHHFLPTTKLLLESTDAVKLVKLMGNKSPNSKVEQRIQCAKVYFQKQKNQQGLSSDSTNQQAYEAINEPSKKELWDDFNKLDKALFQKGSMQKPAMREISKRLSITFRIGPKDGRKDFKALDV
ncbi:MAG: hypothetical protein JJU10_11115 [Idiomarina sp.]|nr:hypothetical protein [Idiomarina sp.]